MLAGNISSKGTQLLVEVQIALLLWAREAHRLLGTWSCEPTLEPNALLLGQSQSQLALEQVSDLSRVAQTARLIDTRRAWVGDA